MHVVLFSRKFRSESNSAVYLVDIGAASDGYRRAEKSRRFAVYRKKRLDKFCVRVHFMRLYAVYFREGYSAEFERCVKFCFDIFEVIRNRETTIEFSFYLSVGIIEYAENSRKNTGFFIFFVYSESCTLSVAVGERFCYALKRARCFVICVQKREKFAKPCNGIVSEMRR